ncbi:MAG: ABC transporter permease [Alphaproteobacteria bacterium]
MRWPALMLAVLLVAWETAIRLLQVPEFIMPAPSRIFASFLPGPIPIYRHMWVTLSEIALGFAGATLLGVALAMAITLWRPFEEAIYPVLVASQAVPKLAVAPLFVIWMGFGMDTKVVIAVLIAFFPVVIDTVAGLRSAPIEMIYLARTMGAGRWQLFRHFILPHALPHLFSGLKVAVTLAVSGAVVAEFVGADRGLGYLIMVAAGKMQTELVFAAVVLLAAIGIGLFYLIMLAERLALPWHVSFRARRSD